MSGLPESAFDPLRELVAAFVSRQDRASQPGGDPGGGQGRPGVEPEEVTVRIADLVRPGRPGLISVIADLPGRSVHGVFGLRSPGDEASFLDDANEAPLGILEDAEGLAVVFDATTDTELALLLLDAIGASGSATGVDGKFERVRRISITPDTVSLTFDDRRVLTVFEQLPLGGGSHPGLGLYLALDRVGFNHLLPPVALWRNHGVDLGMVQEYQAGSTGGWGLALTSLRDLYASGGTPEAAGADFGPEAKRLGVMTARMHLGLDQAFGRQMGDVAEWVAAVEQAVEVAEPELLGEASVARLLVDLRASTSRCAAIRTHGDFHLGRVARTDLGWFVLDFSSGPIALLPVGAVATEGPRFRSPLADVADMLWSFHHVADVAATERDPSGQLGLTELAQAWEVRNRRAFLTGYLSTPGIGGLVPPNRDMVRKLAAAFELGRSASKLALRV